MSSSTKQYSCSYLSDHSTSELIVRWPYLKAGTSKGITNCLPEEIRSFWYIRRALLTKKWDMKRAFHGILVGSEVQGTDIVSSRVSKRF